LFRDFLGRTLEIIEFLRQWIETRKIINLSNHQLKAQKERRERKQYQN